MSTATGPRAGRRRPVDARWLATAALAALLLAGPAAPVEASPAGDPAGGEAVGGAVGPAVPAPADTLRLVELHREARELDPRSRQISLYDRATRARLEGIGGRWLPQLRITAEGTYQTETAEAVAGAGEGALPGGLSVPVPPKDRYDAALEVEQMLWDGDRISRRKAVERAAGAERRATARIGLHDLRAELDAAFFSALRHQERAEQVRLLLDDLAARRDLVVRRVRAGATVPAELAAVEAEQIRARQELEAAGAARRAALERMSLLTGREIGPGTVLAVPALERRAEALRTRIVVESRAPETGAAAPPAGRRRSGERGAAGPWRRRPEWRRLERTERRLRAEAALAAAESRPRVSAFVRGAVGRPGLDFFDDAVSPYAVMGIRMSWSLFDGGDAGSRDRALRLQARAAGAERAALGEVLRRRASAVLPEIDRLVRALDSDERLVTLEERRHRTALRRLEEGVLLPSEYIERRNDVFDARLHRRLHRVRLAEQRARLLRILGQPLPDGRAPGLEVPIRSDGTDDGASR